MTTIKNAAEWLADKANIRKQEQRLDDVRRRALLDHPFMGDKALRSKLGLNAKISTARTDGRRVEFSPLFMALLPFAQLLFVFLHELLHISLGHHVRRGERDPAKWNQACDYVVNRILVAAGLELPEGALYDPRFDELSEEEIYSILAKEEDEGGNTDGPQEEGEDEGNPGGEGSEEGEEENEDGGGNTDTNDCEEEGEDEGEGEDEDHRITEPGQPGGEPGQEGGEEEPSDPSNDGEGGYELPDPSEWGEVEDLTDDDGEALDEKERNKELVKQAIENEGAKRLGSMIGDGGGGAFADALDGAWKKSRYDWAAELEDAITQCVTGDPETTFDRPNRRFIGSGEYLPGAIREGVGRIAILSDASGSVDSREFDLGLAQCEAIINDLPQAPEAVVWVQFDDEVRSAEVFEDNAAFENPTRNGYGGTLIGPAFKWLEDSGEEYACIVVLTDMGIFDYDDVTEPACPVIWADTYGSYGDRVPFGRIIRITADV